MDNAAMTRNLRFNLLVKLGALLYPAYRFKWPQLNWVHDAPFNAYLARFGEESGLNAERRWMVRELMRLTEDVPGDTAECGAYEGAGSFLICEMNAANKRHRRHHHVFDSFEGLSRPVAIDGVHWKMGDMARGEDLVRRNLAAFDAFTLYKGWIPKRFADVQEKSFSFVHIDVDIYEPTRACLEFFYERTSEGGVIVCDDYGFTTCPGATRAVQEFLNDKSEKMLALTGGGGFLVKNVRTARHGGIGAE
jgi:O-methyltransferase